MKKTGPGESNFINMAARGKNQLKKNTMTSEEIKMSNTRFRKKYISFSEIKDLN
jgi:hypothetical protein